jgi:SAM-dependent methyltransferase
MSDAVKQHWEDPRTVSMYDKLWAAQERRLMLRFLPGTGTVLDVGCGEGEALAEYAAERRCTRFVGVDYSAEQLSRARLRCGTRGNINLIQAQWPALDEPRIYPKNFDCVMSTRFLINILDEQACRTAVRFMADRVAPGGKLLLMEGSQDGHNELNALRLALGLPALPLAKHNRFLSDFILENNWLGGQGLQLCGKLGFGAFFLATRGIQPYFDPDPEWNSEFNIAAASPEFHRLFPDSAQFSRIRLWVYSKEAA